MGNGNKISHIRTDARSGFKLTVNGHAEIVILERKNVGLNCASSCKECHDSMRTNALVVDPDIEKGRFERSFSDLFD